MSTHGASSRWPPAADHDEPANQGTDYGRREDSAATDYPASAGHESGDEPLSGSAAEDVVVAESVHTGDQGSADYAYGPGIKGPPVSSTAAGSDAAVGGVGGVGGFGGGAAAPADSALAGSGMATGTMSAAGDSAAEWSEIKALFVDDPTGSVRRASALVEGAVDGFMAALRQRQQALGSWQEGDATGTEDLRVALRGYRDLFRQLRRMSGQFPGRTGRPAPGEPGDGAPVS